MIIDGITENIILDTSILILPFNKVTDNHGKIQKNSKFSEGDY